MPGGPVNKIFLYSGCQPQPISDRLSRPPKWCFLVKCTCRYDAIGTSSFRDISSAKLDCIQQRGSEVLSASSDRLWVQSRSLSWPGFCGKDQGRGSLCERWANDHTAASKKKIISSTDTLSCVFRLLSMSPWEVVALYSFALGTLLTWKPSICQED